MPRYNVGDMVKVREDLTCNFDMPSAALPVPVWVDKEMEEYRGKYLFIASVILFGDGEAQYRVYYNNVIDDWVWADYMFEDTQEDYDANLRSIDYDILKGIIS